MGTFVISKRTNDEYKFEFVSRKGKNIFTSVSYELKFECEEDIELLKASLDTCNYLRFKTAKGKCFFKIILGDRIIAVSRKYATTLMLEKGINEIVKYASLSEVIDFSAGDALFLDA